jgi:hypothetical protein
LVEEVEVDVGNPDQPLHKTIHEIHQMPMPANVFISLRATLTASDVWGSSGFKTGFNADASGTAQPISSIGNLRPARSPRCSSC